MPSAFSNLPGGGCRIVLQPNGSLSARGARLFLTGTGAALGGIGLYFTARGFWPVLPFAGLEFAVLWWALRASMRSSARREIIDVGGDVVRIERRDGQGVQHREFMRHWTRVRLQPAAARTHPARLLIESHGRSLEIGRFLNEEERRSLHPALRRVVGAVGESPPLGRPGSAADN